MQRGGSCVRRGRRCANEAGEREAAEEEGADVCMRSLQAQPRTLSSRLPHIRLPDLRDVHLRRIQAGAPMNPAIREAIEKADAASEHLLIHHANADVGTLVTDDLVGGGTKQHVIRHQFNSPCVTPNECWNTMDAAIRNLARTVIEEAAGAVQSTTFTFGRQGLVDAIRALMPAELP